MAHSMIKKLQNVTREHPLISAGFWFSFFAWLPGIPILFILICLGLILSRPVGEVIQILIPAILTTAMIAALLGMLPGYKIICLPSHGTPRAGLYGLATGLAVLLVWVMLLELLPNLSTLNANQNPSADLPGAAVIVAYLVLLPGLVIFAMAYGAVAGILLHLLAVYPLQRAD